jgi:hypothetical protein
MSRPTADDIVDPLFYDRSAVSVEMIELRYGDGSALCREHDALRACGSQI